MKKEENKNRNNNVKMVVFVFIIIIVLLVVFFLLFSKNNIFESEKENTVRYGALICERNYQESGDILTTNNPVSVDEELDVVYRNDELDRISFVYTGTYATHADAVQAEANIHAAYNIYIGKLGIGTGDYVNTYDIMDDVMKMTLTTGVERINRSSYPLFFLDEEDDMGKMSVEDFREAYNNKGFSCETKKM